MKVLTTKGLVELSDMDVQDIVEVADNHRKVATEYRLNGELVKRSVSVDIFRPLMSGVTHGDINGK